MQKEDDVFAGVIRSKEERDQNGGARHGYLVFVFSFVVLLLHDTSLRSLILNLLFCSKECLYVSAVGDVCDEDLKNRVERVLQRESVLDVSG